MTFSPRVLQRSGYGTVYTNGDGESTVSYLNPIEKVPSSAFFDKDGKTFVRTNKGVLEVDDAVACFNEATSSSSGEAPPNWVRWIQEQGGWEGDLPEWVEAAAMKDGFVWTPGVGKVEVFSSLNACRNFADTVTLYCDPMGGTVRVVVAK